MDEKWLMGTRFKDFNRDEINLLSRGLLLLADRFKDDLKNTTELHSGATEEDEIEMVKIIVKNIKKDQNLINKMLSEANDEYQFPSKTRNS